MSTDPHQIRTEIDQTQQELSADVDALTEKLSPPRIMERRVRHTRMAMTNMKDKIMGSTAQGASNAWETASSGASGMGDTISSKASAARDTATATVSSASDAARSAPDLIRRRAEGNPLAVGLIAFGAGWLLSSLLPASAPEQQVANQVKDLATDKGGPLADQLSEAGQQVIGQLRESAQHHTESVKDTAADAASTVADTAQSAASRVSGQAQQATSTVTEQARPSGHG